MPASALPVGTQFSPNVVNLRPFLQVLKDHAGNKQAMMDAVAQTPVNARSGAAPDTPRARSLPIEAAVQYELLDPQHNPTALVDDLLSTTTDDDLYQRFAHHLLVNLGYVRVLDAIEQMQLDGIRVAADPLARYLTAQGFVVPEHNTGINSGRMWLAKAGVISATGWSINYGRKATVIGLADDEIAHLVGLSADQRDFVRSLCVLDPTGEILAKSVREHAEMRTGRVLPRDSAVNNFLKPLSEIGLVTYQSGGSAGGKSAKLTVTTKFKAEVLAPFLDRAVRYLDTSLAEYYRKPPSETFATLDDPGSTTHARGMALEAFAILAMRRLGLRFVGWRARPADLGYAEVDAVLAGLIGGLVTRWQIQCKCTTSTTSTDVIQRELGLLPMTKATHVMIISTGGFTAGARQFVNRWMRESPVSVFLLGKEEYGRLKNDPGSIAAIIREQSEQIVAIPRAGIEWL